MTFLQVRKCPDQATAPELVWSRSGSPNAEAQVSDTDCTEQKARRRPVLQAETRDVPDPNHSEAERQSQVSSREPEDVKWIPKHSVFIGH